MSDKKLVYIGETPPPYGGVTVKNKQILEILKGAHNIKMIDLMRCKYQPVMLIKCIVGIIDAFCRADHVIYGLGSMHRLEIIVGIQRLFPKSMKKTTVIAMGGLFAIKVLNSRILRMNLRNINGLLVETESMKEILKENGFNNVVLYPNPKSETDACSPRERKMPEPLRLVYFSQISEEKGILDAIGAIEKLTKENKWNFTIDFYGHIIDDIKDKFLEFIAKNKNAEYKGVVDSTKTNVYLKLNTYDILLFPTKWKGEGVPGVLVEAKMAGIAVICSNHAYNREIILENEGLILEKNFQDELVTYIKTLCDDNDFLNKLKEGSSKSRARYSLNTYKAVLFGCVGMCEETS